MPSFLFDSSLPSERRLLGNVTGKKLTKNGGSTGETDKRTKQNADAALDVLDCRASWSSSSDSRVRAERPR